jgi:hypothetical protein
MLETERVLFVTSRPSRASNFSVPAADIEYKHLREREWAVRLGIDPVWYASTGTPVECDINTPSATIIGTETNNGMDESSDVSHGDENADTVVDGETADNGNA